MTVDETEGLEIRGDGEVVDGYYIIFTTPEGDEVGIQTIKDGEPLDFPELYTSRPMTDEEIGRTIRLALENDGENE